MTNQFVVKLEAAAILGEHRGSGRAIVFLHAGVADQRMWAHQMDEFQTTHVTVAYDRRGFGKTTTKDESFRHIDDLAAVLDDQGIKEAVICGCSQGARIAIDFTLAYPNRTKALVLVGATYSGADWTEVTDREIELTKELDAAESEHDLDLANRLEAHLWLDGPSAPAGRVNNELRELFLDMNGIALAAPELSNEIEPPSAKNALHKISCPTLLVEGDLDFVMIQRHHEELSNKIKSATRVRMNGTAHLPPMEYPDRFNAHLREFLAVHAN